MRLQTRAKSLSGWSFGRLLFTGFLLLAFLFQSNTTQTHLHFNVSAMSTAQTLAHGAAAANSDAVKKDSSGRNNPDDCPLCQLLHGGQYVASSTVILFLPMAAVRTIEILAGVAPALRSGVPQLAKPGSPLSADRRISGLHAPRCSVACCIPSRHLTASEPCGNRSCRCGDCPCHWRCVYQVPPRCLRFCLPVALWDLISKSQTRRRWTATHKTPLTKTLATARRHGRRCPDLRSGHRSWRATGGPPSSRPCCNDLIRPGAGEQFRPEGGAGHIAPGA